MLLRPGAYPLAPGLRLSSSSSVVLVLLGLVLLLLGLVELEDEFVGLLALLELLLGLDEDPEVVALPPTVEPPLVAPPVVAPPVVLPP